MKFNKLPMIVLLAIIVVSLIVIASTVTSQKNEMNRLRMRVDNLETVINQGVKFEIQAEEKPKLSAERI